MGWRVVDSLGVEVGAFDGELVVGASLSRSDVGDGVGALVGPSVASPRQAQIVSWRSRRSNSAPAGSAKLPLTPLQAHASTVWHATPASSEQYPNPSGDGDDVRAQVGLVEGTVVVEEVGVDVGGGVGGARQTLSALEYSHTVSALHALASRPPQDAWRLRVASSLRCSVGLEERVRRRRPFESA